MTHTLTCDGRYGNISSFKYTSGSYSQSIIFTDEGILIICPHCGVPHLLRVNNLSNKDESELAANTIICSCGHQYCITCTPKYYRSISVDPSDHEIVYSVCIKETATVVGNLIHLASNPIATDRYGRPSIKKTRKRYDYDTATIQSLINAGCFSNNTACDKMYFSSVVAGEKLAVNIKYARYRIDTFLDADIVRSIIAIMIAVAILGLLVAGNIAVFNNTAPAYIEILVALVDASLLFMLGILAAGMSR
jgi:hypothetical protein